VNTDSVICFRRSTEYPWLATFRNSKGHVPHGCRRTGGTPSSPPAMRPARARRRGLCGRAMCDQLLAARICALHVTTSHGLGELRLIESPVSQGSLRSHGCW
jgi:hypothetical protein